MDKGSNIVPDSQPKESCDIINSVGIKRLSVVGISFLAFGLLYLLSLQPVENTNEDAIVLTMLSEQGSDLNKPHTIDFFLYFSSEAAARTADEAIRTQWPFLQADIHQTPTSNEWTIVYRATMVPELNQLAALRQTFEKHGADYDGWGAGVEK